MDEFDDTIETWTVVVDADTTALKKELSTASSLGKQFSSALSSAFDGIAIKGKGLGDVLRGLALDISKITLKAAFKPLEQGFGNLLSGLFTGGLSAGGASPAPLPVPFAQGGVISNPVLFPLGRGGLGKAGERGAEAILPLARGPDGRLGVAAQSGGAGVNVTFNVSTPNAASFQRSQTQVAAMLSRAVSLGQRNL